MITKIAQEDYDDGRQWIYVTDGEGSTWEEWYDWPEYTHDAYYFLNDNAIDPNIIYGVIKRVAKLHRSIKL